MFSMKLNMSGMCFTIDSGCQQVRKFLEMKKIDFSRSLSMSKSAKIFNPSYGPSDGSGTFSIFSRSLGFDIVS